MTPALPSRRRAERFDALVSGRTTHVSARDLEELAALVGALRSLPEVAPRPEFSADLRSRLMAAADTALAPSDATDARLRLPARPASRDRRLATVLGGAALLGATTSMAVAAQSALPGDTLYPVKRAIEEAQAGFQDDESSRGVTLLANASGRLDEVSALLVRGTDDGIAETPETLSDFTAQSREAADHVFRGFRSDHDPAPIAELRDFTRTSMDRLVELQTQLPGAAHDELVRAARALTEIDAEAERLCPACGGAGIDEIPRILLSAASAGVASVTVPTAERPQRPARSTSVRETSDTTGTSLPDVSLDDGQATATGDDTSSGTTTSTPKQPSAPTTGPTQDPVTELTSTLSSRDADTSTETRVETEDPVGAVLEGVEGTTDGLLD